MVEHYNRTPFFANKENLGPLYNIQQFFSKVEVNIPHFHSH